MAAQLVSRFFARVEVTLQSVLKSHFIETGKRCSNRDTVVVAQDTTFLNYDSHKALKGLSFIGTSPKTEGLVLHTGMAVSLDRTPLGIVSCRIVERLQEETGKYKDYRNRTFADKESYKWAQALIDAENAIPVDQKMIMVGDRENDFYEYFALPRRKNTDILVRMLHSNRSVIDDKSKKLSEMIENAPVIGNYTVDIPGSKSRKARNAKLEVKIFPVTIKKAIDCTRKDAPKSIALNCVVAREIDAPPDVESAINRVILTSIFSKTLDDAIYAIRLYSTRWVIEEFHKVLKTGAKVERLQMETLDSLFPAIGVLCVIAWRILYITKFARSTPDYPASEFAAKTEITVLESWMKVKNEKKYRSILTVSDFVLFVAYLGNFPGRKCDGQPGAKVIWEGIRKLDNIVEYHKVYEKLNAK